jgi:hypothetical protein
MRGTVVISLAPSRLVLKIVVIGIFSVCALLTQVPLSKPRIEPAQRRFDDLAEASRIPPQQDYSPGVDPGPPPPFIEMGDPRSAECIVRDVSSGIEGDGWRWTYLQPTLRFHLQDYETQRFIMDFSVVERTFKDTGPVTLSCYINNRLLTKLHCAKPGDYHIDMPAPASWLRDAHPTIVRAVLDKVWTSPADGVRLSYVLYRAGFRRSPQ